MGYKTVGNSLAEWDDDDPYDFTLTEEDGAENVRHKVTVKIAFSELSRGCTDNFLFHLRNLVIEWRTVVSINTIANYSRQLKYLLSNIYKQNLFYQKIDIVDESFLLAVGAIKDSLKEMQLYCLRRAFYLSPHSPLWSSQIQARDFPQRRPKKGVYGQQIDRILAKALSRATCVNILSRCEQAYESGQLDIGHFAFANLAFAVFCRPESYRQIRLSDLVYDAKSGGYFLYILPTKSRVARPEKICYRINEPVGLLLQKQRQNVVQKYGHLVHYDDISKLSLFPARRLHNNRSKWVHVYANENFGMLEDQVGFTGAYPTQIRRVLLKKTGTLSANVLRHTIGTQLAHTGASSKTIQAVLKHATDNVCRAYVDIAFHGLIDVLSDAMQPAFENHLPVFENFRSKLDPVLPEQAVRSENLRTGNVELTGECGKQIQCEYAPISCYGCSRFIPCWDADHSINLDIVQQEINDCSRRGRPFQHLTERALTAKYQIIIIMNAADRYKENIVSGDRHGCGNRD
ncbi:hypothetical protein [Pseudoduganella sp. UC29_71]|uniref:hypothetical protein n=1 Tax=Pseudoduganella sp. UC29_71 TaxID=3350174 RepID=UPI00366AA22F